MKWFFAFNEGASYWFADMVKVAVISAREHTDLVPYCIYDGARTPLTDWLLNNGVTIISARVPFYLDLFSDRVTTANAGSHYSPDHASGTFLKIQACLYAEIEPILVTDCDVMFMGDPVPLLPIDVDFSAVAEGRLSENEWSWEEGQFNAGVLYFSPDKVRARYARFLKLVRDNHYYFREAGSYDQMAMNLIMGDEWERLPLSLNWRPIQGIDGNVKIAHFHGPKPHRIKAIIDGEATAEEASSVEMYNFNPKGYTEYLDAFFKFLAKA